ncbi:MAG: diguanylate cyclase [Sulfuricurvum sp.]|nr:diguanylate cyclase [Sulfuricurvum sp.]
MTLLRSLLRGKPFSPIFQPKESLFKKIFHHSPIAQCVSDDNGVIQYANQAFTELTGYPSEELIGTNLSLLTSVKNDYNFFKQFWETLLNDKTFSGKIWNQHKDGLHALHAVTVTPIQFDKNYYLSTHINVTDESELQERYHYLAYHDPHTGLANRSLFEDRLEHAIKNASRGGYSVGIIFCDLNEFKQINDDFGHLTGDDVLVEVAKRIKSFFRINDTVARFGGDEFVIVVENLANEMELTRLAETLARKITEPLSELKLSLTASIGTASFPKDGLTKEQLLKIADDKMYHNKNKFYGLES